MTTTERHLRNRAESYWRDSEKLTGIERMAYRTIAEELRKVADELCEMEGGAA